MQGKGIIKFFAAAMLLVSVYQLLLIVPTRNVEKKAKQYASKLAANANGSEKDILLSQAEQFYLDSVSKKTVLNLGVVKYTYEDLKRQQIALGLDLQGGMSVVMQVDLEDFLVNLSNNNTSDKFRQAIAEAKKRQASSQADFITLFVEAYKEAAGANNLAMVFVNNPSLQEEINVESTDAQVLKVIREKANSKVEETYNLLKKRIDKFGVTQPTVFLDKSTDRITVELPGVKNPKRAEKFLQASAKLEFYEVYLGNELGNQLMALDKALDTKTTDVATPATDSAKVDSSATPKIDSSKVATVDTAKADTSSLAGLQKGPLFSKMEPVILDPSQGRAANIGIVEAADTARVLRMLRGELAQTLLPTDVKFLLSSTPTRDIKSREYTSKYEVYAIKVPTEGTAPMDGDMVDNARADKDQTTGEDVISLRMTEEGARLWGDLTQKNIERPIAIVLDDQVQSAPFVNEAITSGNSQISGSFTATEANDLSNILNIGKLPAKTKIIEKAEVGPSLGKETIRAGLLSMALGLVVVMLFMIGYYSTAGVVSVLALIANLFFILASLSSLGTVLTLPGIAGIVLTIGMSVDANVIIYERIREEIRLGKAMNAALMDGFKNSMSSIIDANVTTFLTAMILAWLGLGPIKGFGIVLMVGVVCSVFAAVLVARLIFEWWLARGGNISFGMPATINALTKFNVDFVGKRKIAYIASAVVILAGVGSMFTRSFELGVDLKGGRTYTIQFPEGTTVNTDALAADLGTFFVENGKPVKPVVKEFSKSNQVKVTTSFMQSDTITDADAKILAQLKLGLEKHIGKTLTNEEFVGDANTNRYVQAQNKVGATIADDIRNSAWQTTVVALLLIFVYILIRFKRWQFSAGAVVALFHDVLVVLAMFSLLHGILPFSLEIDQTFIAAILTVIGYSVNDTVIVFDRIREYLNTYRTRDAKVVINEAINTTLSRTLLTSSTTLFVVICLFLFGGAGIKGFSFALLIGILVGTYSSIFIATPVVIDLTPNKDLEAFDAPEVVAESDSTEPTSKKKSKA